METRDTAWMFLFLTLKIFWSKENISCECTQTYSISLFLFYGMDNLCTPGTVTALSSLSNTDNTEKRRLTRVTSSQRETPAHFSTHPFLKYRSRTNMFFTFFFSFFFLNQRLTHRHRGQLRLGWMLLYIVINTVNINHAHTHTLTHTHTVDSFQKRSIYKKYIYISW